MKSRRVSRFGRMSVIAVLCFAVLLSVVPQSVLAAPLPQATVEPTDIFAFPGESFEFTVTFSNDASSAAGNVGYSPAIEVILPPGVSFADLSSSLFGELTPVQQTPVPPSGTVTNSLTNQQVGGLTPNSTYLLIRLPVGSFTPDQIADELTFTANLASSVYNNEDPITTPITARGIFLFGASPTGRTPITQTDWSDSDVIPTLYIPVKTATTRYGEEETATGPNYPITYTLGADIANGATLTGFEFLEEIPDNLQYSGITNIIIAGSGDPDVTIVFTPETGSPVTTGPAPLSSLTFPISGGLSPATNAPGGTLSVTFDSVTGTSGIEDVVVEFEGFVPLEDTAGDPIVHPATGADNVVSNVLSVSTTGASGDFGTVESTPARTTEPVEVAARNFALQKSVEILTDNNVEGLSPGDIVRFTLDLQVSDYFSQSHLAIQDILGDGYEYNEGSSRIESIVVRGVPVSPDSDEFSDADLPTAPDIGTSGYGPPLGLFQRVLVTPGAQEGEVQHSNPGFTSLVFDISSIVIGGANLDTLAGIITNGGESEATGFTEGIREQTTISITFDATVLENYENDASWEDGRDPSIDAFDVLENRALVTGITNSEGRDSETTSSIQEIAEPTLTKALVAINRADAPTSNIEVRPGDAITFELEVVIPTGSLETLALTDFLPLPVFNAGEVTTFTGECDGYPVVGTACYAAGTTEPPLSTYPDIVTNAIENTVTFEFDDIELFEVSPPREVTVTIHFTATVTHEPFRDGLHLTNVAAADYGNSRADARTGTGTTSFVLREPDLDISKTVSPTSGVDAGDTVTYTIVVTNVGGHDAYDVGILDETISDLPLTCATGTIDTGSGPSAIDGNDLNDLLGTGDGMIVLGPIPPAGTITITLTCVVTIDAEPGEVIENTVEITRFSNQSSPDASNFIDDPENRPSDDAEFSIRSPQIAKVITETDQSFTTGNNVAIGEIVTYQVTVTVPEGTSPDVRFRDTLDRGLAYVSGSFGFTASPGITIEHPDAAPTFSNPGVADQVDGRMLVTFGDIVNSNTVNAEAETIVISYQAVVLNNQTNNAGVQLNNDAEWYWGTASTTGGCTPASETCVQVGAPNVTVREPDLTVSKTSPTTEADANDVVTYTITVSNSGGATGHDVVLTDIVPDGMTYVGGSFQHDNTTLPPNFTSDTDPTGAGLTARWSSFPVSGTSRFTFQARVDQGLETGLVITNSANVIWSSLPGDPPSVSTPNGSTFACERSDPDDATTCAGGEAFNDYEASATHDVEIFAPARVAKELVSTSETEPGDSDPGDLNLANNPPVQIGELLTYTIEFSFPEAITPDATLADVLHTPAVSDAMVLVNATLARNSEGLEAEDNPGGINTATPGVAVDVFPLMVDGDREYSLDLGDVENSDTDADLETYTLTLTYRVNNTLGNNAGVTLTDHAELRYGDNMTVETNEVSVHIAEPDVAVSKSASPTSITGGSLVTFTITISNEAPVGGANSASAFDWTITDTLPALYLNPSVTGTNNGTTGATIDAGFSGNTLNVTIDELNPGESVTVTYTATVDPEVQFGEEILNTVHARATSLRGNEPGERTGEGEINDLHDNSTQTTVAGVPTIEKSLDPDNSPYAIGDLATFVVEVGVPVGTARNFELTDVLDAGLIYAPGSLSVNLPAASNSSQGTLDDTNASFFSYDTGTNTITLDFDTLTIGTAGNVEITYQAFVANVIGNQSGVRLDNSATVEFDDPNDPDEPVTTGPATPEDPVVIGEPNIEMTKAVTSGAVGSTAGDTVTWQVTIQNTGNTTAYQLNWSDVMPDGPADLPANDGIFNVTNPQIQISGGNVYLNNTSTAPVASDVSVTTTTNPDDTISLPPLEIHPGATITITWDTTVGDAVQPNQVLINATAADYTSVPVDNGHERDGSDGGDDDEDEVLNNYNESTNTQLTVGADIAISKTVTPTSYAIGQLVTYNVTVEVIQGTTSALVITDDLPSGLEYVGHSIAFGNTGMQPGNADFNNRLGTGQTVTFDFGNLANPADGSSSNDFITVSIVARVLNVAGNQNGTVLGNHAHLTFEDAGGDPQRVDFDADAEEEGIQPREITIIEPELGITKTVSPVSQSLGDTVTYTVTVEHLASSTADAYQVVVVDQLPAGLTYIDGSAIIPNGGSVVQTGQVLTFTFSSLTLADASVTFTYQAQIDVTAVSGAPLENDADLTWTSIPDATGDVDGGRTGSDGPGGELNDYADEDSAIVTPSTAAFIDIEKSVADLTGDPDLTMSGDTLEYTIVVTNTNGPVTGVVVTDAIPVGTTYVDGSLTVTDGPGTADDSGDPLVVTIGDMADDESTTFTFQVVIDAFTPTGTIITNTATVDSDQTVPTSDDADRPVGEPVQPGVRVEKRVALTGDTVAPTDGTINVGDQVTYTITVINTGQTDLTGLVFTDEMPAGVDLVSASGADWTCDITDGVSCTFDLTDLGVGESSTIQIVATVNAPGVHVNQGSITTNEIEDPVPTDGNDDPNDGEQPTEFPAEEVGVSGTPAIDVWKSVSIVREHNGDGQLNPGETIRYTITIQNTGSAPATNVTMVDDLPSFTTLVPPGVTTTQGIVINPGIQPPPDVPAPYQVAVNLGTIPAGGLATVTIDLFVHEDVPVPGEIANQSLTDFNENPGEPVPSDDPSTDDPDDPTRIPVTDPWVFDPPSGFKTVDPTGYPVLEWQMVWINPSNDVATNSRVIDPIPADTTYIDGSLECLPAGSSSTVLCEYDETNNQVVWEGSILPDPGATSEEDAPNAVVIRYQTTVGPDVSEVQNQACAYWDSDGDGFIGGPDGDPDELEQVPVCTDDPTTGEPDDPTFWRAPDLSVEKWREGALVVGQQGAYWLTVRNVGEGATFNPITVVDYLPSGLEFVSATGAGWDCVYDGARHAAVCETDVILEPGESLSPIILVVDVTLEALPSVLNVVEVDTDGDIVPDNNRDDDESSVVDLTTPPGDAEWDGETDPGLLCDHQCTAGSIFFPWVGNDDDFGLGPADTSISIQNLEDRDAYIFIYRGIGTESLLGEEGWELATVAYLSAYASKTFTPEQLGIESGDGAPIGVGGYHTAITDDEGRLFLDQVSIGGYAKQASGGENLPYTSPEDDVVDGYNAFSCLEIKTFNDWYLPIVQRNVGPGGAWNTIVRVANFGGYAEDGELLTNRNAAVTLRFFPADDGSGSLQTGFQLQYHVSSGDTVNIDIADYVPEGWVGSVHIYSDGAVAAMADRYKNEGYKVWLTTTASNPGHEAQHNQTQDGSQLAPYVLFAPDVRLNYFGWNTGINVANLVNEYNNVTIQYFNQFGNAPATLTQRLGPQGMTYFYNPSLEGQNISTQDPRSDVNSSVVGSALIWSDHPIAVAVDATKYPVSDPNASIGQIQGITYNATANVYPWQAVPLVQKGNPSTGMGATSGINIMNPNNVANQVTVHWFNPSGASADNFGTSTLAIPAYANGFVYTLAQHNLPNGFYGSAVVTSVYPVAATSAQVDYEVGDDGAVIWNAYNPGGFYRVSGCYHYGPVFDQPYGGAIEVEVVDEEGQAIVGVGVMIYNDAAYEQIILGNNANLGIAWTGTGVTDMNGEINWLNMPEGDYWIVVTTVPRNENNLDLYSGRGSIHGPHRLNGGTDIVIPIELTRRPLP